MSVLKTQPVTAQSAEVGLAREVRKQATTSHARHNPERRPQESGPSGGETRLGVPTRRRRTLRTDPFASGRDSSRNGATNRGAAIATGGGRQGGGLASVPHTRIRRSAQPTFRMTENPPASAGLAARGKPAKWLKLSHQVLVSALFSVRTRSGLAQVEPAPASPRAARTGWC
jgi:hypothetical protein